MAGEGRVLYAIAIRKSQSFKNHGSFKRSLKLTFYSSKGSFKSDIDQNAIIFHSHPCENFQILPIVVRNNY